MAWVKIDTDAWALEPTPDPAQIVTGEELRAELEMLSKTEAAIPKPPSDVELLEWARANYPYFNREAERAPLLARMAEIQTVLAVS